MENKEIEQKEIENQEKINGAKERFASFINGCECRGISHKDIWGIINPIVVKFYKEEN